MVSASRLVGLTILCTLCTLTAVAGLSEGGGNWWGDTGLAHSRSLQAKRTKAQKIHYNRVRAAHGWTSVIGLGFLIPLGVTLAMVGKNTRTWKGVFWLHGISQVAGLILGIIGAIIGRWMDLDGELLKAHRAIGIAVVTAVAVQIILAIAWHPAPKSATRYIFQAYHWWLGRLVAALAIANVFIGIQSQRPRLSSHYFIIYGVVIGVMFLVWLVAAMIKERNTPIFIPQKYIPTEKDEFAGTELGSAHANGNAKGFSDDYTNGGNEPKLAHV